MIPADPWHSEQADWRIGIVTQLEHQYPGCDDHTVGVAVLNR